MTGTPGLDDHSVIVTGASRGIGRAIASRVAEQGAYVVICSRTRADVEAVAAEVEDETGATVRPVECDITDEASVAALIETTVDAFGGVDVLVNNAGGSFEAPFDELSGNAWASIVELNLNGAVNCLREAREPLCADGGGAVVNLASNAGVEGAPGLSHYGAAKAGIVNLTRTLANEWAPHGVRVNAVAPGVVATPGIEEQLGVTATEIDRAETDRRVGRPAEIADVVAFLAGPGASYVNGETLPVRGNPRIENVGQP